MKKIVSLFLAVLMMLSAVSFAGAEESADAVQAYLNAMDVNYAYELAVKLSTDKSLQDNSLGFRTAGSDAEHRAAEFIAEEMRAIGLQDVELIPVTVDKWQFNGASLTIEGTDIDLMPVSYMLNGTSAEGITAEIVDCGTGFAYDYEDKDVAGKIVLIGVDQWNEAWIGQYIAEAYVQGAAAVVSYDIDGYGRWSDDVYQIQDVCCEDLMPTVIVTKAMGDTLINAIAEGHNQCTLIVDSVMEIGTGVSYDVVGRIPGRSSEQQMIVSGHYDMYFEGFQDDCSAIACAMAIGKGIIDSKVQPENDVLIIAHGAEEWGISGTEFDWTRGAWELINTVHPEWAEKTIALFNFELCAFDDGNNEFAVSCVPEYRTLVAEMVENNAFTVQGRTGVNPVTFDTTTMEDGISYRNAGVPYFINVTDTCAGELRPADTYGWSQLHYHTQSDDVTTYDENTMFNNIAVFGTILLSIDAQPALCLDLTQSCADLADAFDTSYAEEAGVDVEAYAAAMDALNAACEQHNARIADVNARYAAAATQEEKDAIRAEGVLLNKTTLAAFKMVQDEFIRIEFSSDVVQRHMGYQDNLCLLDDIIAALEKGELFNDEENGALDLAWGLNALAEYAYYIFTPEAADCLALHADAARGNAQLWGKEKGYVYANTWPATCSLLMKAEEEAADFADELAVYTAERAAQLALLGTELNAEIAAMNSLTELLK
ncbi:MAG: M28 family peptidase [Clostridia bacterium]|nr:M28 family peptidase [Clostridia bacterium]